MIILRHFKIRTTIVVLAVLWCVGVLFLTRSIPVSLQFEATKGSVAAVSVGLDGGESSSPALQIPQNGRLSLPVRRSARTFHFVLYPALGTCSDFKLKTLGVFGMPVFFSHQLCNYLMRKKLFTRYPQGKDPLVLHAERGDVLDFPNVFPFVLRILRLASYCLAGFPLVLVLLWILLPHAFAAAQGIEKLMSPNAWRFVYWIYLVAILLLTLPAPVTAASPGLDPSWVWLFNRFAFTKTIGRDFVFTYGPLGFLISPQLTQTNVAWGICVNCAFTVLFAWMLFLIRRYGRTVTERSPAYLLPLVWTLVWPNGMEWKWCMVSVMACALAGLHPRLSPWQRSVLFASAAVTVALQSLVKFSSLISLLGQSIFLLAYVVLARKSYGKFGAAAFVSTFLLAFGGFVLFLFPSVASFADWVRGSCEISRGYNLYMIADKSPVEFAVAVLMLLVWFFGLVFAAHNRRAAFGYAFLFSPLVYFAFKYAIVRQSGIPMACCSAGLIILSVVFLDVRFKVVCGLSCFLLAVAYGIGFLLCGQTSISAVSVSNLIDTLNVRGAMARTRIQQDAAISKAALPDKWMNVIGDSPVMIVGSEMGPAMSGSLNLVPFPAAQLYSAYTAYLEKRCVDVLSGKQAPKYVLAPAEPWTFDARNVYFDNPCLWSAVRSHYCYVDMTDSYVLLEHRKTPVAEESRTSCFSFRRTLLGRIVALFLRPSRVMARHVYDDGSEYMCAANPDVLDGVHIPLRIPRTKDEVKFYFSSERRLPRICRCSAESSWCLLSSEVPCCNGCASHD